MTRPVRFGILGAGGIAAFHARAIAGQGGAAELVAVASPRLEKAQQLAAQFGARCYDDHAALLADPDIDAVAICTPSGTHAALAKAALLAGKHVVIEKPVDVTLPAIDDLIQTRKQTGKQATVISQHRFVGAARTLHDLVGQGRLGRVVQGDATMKWYRSQAYYDSSAWRGTWALDGGGCMMNQGIHTIDLLQWIMGPVAAVTAYTGTLAHERIEVEDVAVAIVRYVSGALGVLNFTTNAYPGLSARIEVHGTGGSACLEDERLKYLHLQDGGPPAAADQDDRERGGGQSDPLAISELHPLQYRDFLEALAEGRDPAITLEDARRPVEIILACYQSAKTGREVRLPMLG